jgi:ABC-type transport system involved in cytochrome bd biosynthesis fused ATPase/permease subunit
LAADSIDRLANPPGIEVNSLCYGYDASNKVFDKLSFSVSPGEQCVIVGPSGVGKSTLLNLLVGELYPVSGNITIDAKKPSKFFEEYNHDAAYAGPDPLLFEGSIRENLLYGVSHYISNDEILEVLGRLGLQEWARGFNCDLDLELGVDGIGMSSGQAQRLSIARALLRRPKLLILDEVTSNLDASSEQEVLRLLDEIKGSVTVILVTHSDRMMKTFDIKIDLSLCQASEVA